MTTTTETARPFRRVSLASRDLRPSLRYEYRGCPPPPNGWRVTAARMAELDATGLLLFPDHAGGTIRLKRFVDPEWDEPRGGLAGEEA